MPHPIDRKASNAKYCEDTKDRIILRESELRPSAIRELVECLEDGEPHPADKRIRRLRRLFEDLTGSPLG